MKTLFENLLKEYSLLKTEKEKSDLENQKEIHELREAVRNLTDTNEKLENDKKTLQQLIEAKEEAEKRRKAKSYAESLASGSRGFDKDDWIPKYEPKKKTIIIDDSDSDESSSENEWTDAESNRRKKRQTKRDKKKGVHTGNEEKRIPAGRKSNENIPVGRKVRKEAKRFSSRRLAESESPQNIRYCHFYNNSDKGCKKEECSFKHEDAYIRKVQFLP